MVQSKQDVISRPEDGSQSDDGSVPFRLVLTIAAALLVIGAWALAAPVLSRLIGHALNVT